MTDAEQQARSRAIIAELEAQRTLAHNRCVALAQDLAAALERVKAQADKIAELDEQIMAHVIQNERRGD